MMIFWRIFRREYLIAYKTAQNSEPYYEKQPKILYFVISNPLYLFVKWSPKAAAKTADDIKVLNSTQSPGWVGPHCALFGYLSPMEGTTPTLISINYYVCG